VNKLRVAINGFGRIGRVLTRLNLKEEIFDLVAINDINEDIENLAYLLKFDSVYGKLTEQVEVINNKTLKISSNNIKVYHDKNIEQIPWYEDNIDIIIDASGVAKNYFRFSPDDENRFGYYILTSEDPELNTVVCDINESTVDLKNIKYMCASTCDAIALSPIIKAISSKYTIEYGTLMTLHPWLSYQKLTDSERIQGFNKSDAYTLARAATSSLIPKATSAVSAVRKLLPNVTENIESFSYRVPTSAVSSAVINLRVKEKIKQDEVERVLYQFFANQKFKTLSLEYENTVSIDHLGTRYSSIIDTRWNKIKEHNIQLTFWYDNEMGYCSKLMDLIEHISSLQCKTIHRVHSKFKNTLLTV